MRGNVITHLQLCEDNCGQENKWNCTALTIEMLQSPRVIIPQMSSNLSLRAHYGRTEGRDLSFLLIERTCC
jgi:hypothetical protein